MASSTEITPVTTDSGKTATDSGKTVPAEHSYDPKLPSLPNFFGLDSALRLLLFASSVPAVVLMVISKQTKLFSTFMPGAFPSFVSLDANFTHSPAFIYLVAALGLTCIYSLITFIASASVISKRHPPAKLLFILVAHDVLMVGITASATGSAASVAYIGLNGNSHAGWNKICNNFDKFCRYVWISLALSLTSSVVLVLIVSLSTYSLYRRSL